MDDKTREEQHREWDRTVKAVCRFLIAVDGDETCSVAALLFRKDRDGAWPSCQHMDVESYSDAELYAFIREACIRWEKEKRIPRDYPIWGWPEDQPFVPPWERL